LRPLFHFSGFDTNDAKGAHRFVLHRLSPWLGALFPELVVGFFAGELEDQVAVCDRGAIVGLGLVVATGEQLGTARLDAVADLINAAGLVGGLIGDVDLNHLDSNPRGRLAHALRRSSELRLEPADLGRAEDARSDGRPSFRDAQAHRNSADLRWRFWRSP
jgi:hypothetical protein